MLLQSEYTPMPARTTPPTLVLRLLGGFSLERDAQPHRLAYEKSRALLAYLGMAPHRMHPRTVLSELLWPDLTRDAALANLRQIVHDLRRALDMGNAQPAVLQVGRESIALMPGSVLQVDAVAFAAQPTTCETPRTMAQCNPCLAHMQELVQTYQGEFMAGFALPECQAFEQWLQVQREALHLRALGLLSRLASCHEELGDSARALPFAQRFLELEPWNEDGLRRAMRLLAQVGQGGAALALYDSGSQALHQELGILFCDETHALAQRIRRGEVASEARHAGQAPAMTGVPLPAPQHRQVTVLYCELSCLAADDPDTALALLRGPQARCSEAIRRASGYLVQIRGGSLLAYFGYPMASENAARMAVQAALAVTHTGFADLEVRASVHTGMVITGDLQVPDAIGATSGLAIRLRQLAQNAQVVISGATQALVAGYFETSSLGPHALGLSQRPLEVFRVLRDSGAGSRLEAAATLSPLVGRQQELAELLAQWQQVRRGKRRFVLLRGEAGMGKSRLIHALRDALRNEACTVRELRCVEEHSHSPFHPLNALLEQAMGSAHDDTPQERFEQLVAYIETYYADRDPDTVALLARMLSLPLRAPYREPIASAQQLREKTMAILLWRLSMLARQQPFLLVVEDLHWADPSTLDLLQVFMAQAFTVPLLAVFSARSDFDAPWLDAQTRVLALTPLDESQIRTLVSALAPASTPAQVQQMVERADGVPLFAEELARASVGDSPATIPPTLQDLLTARLDKLGPAKRVAQLAATIGRDFSFALLRQIGGLADADLLAHLRQLQGCALVQGTTSAGFSFRHALMRDAAYQSQLRPDREAVHRQIAQALQGGQAPVRPELLAQHWAAAGDFSQAVRCWIAAGKLACQHAASQEAVLQFKAGLALVERLGAGAPADQLELELQIGLGAASCAAQGYASAEGTQAYARAMELCKRTTKHPDLFAAVWGLWASASSRTGYASARDLAEELLHMARQSGNPVQAQQAHFAAGDTLYWQGEFAQSREHLEQVQALYQRTDHASHVAGFGEDAGVTSGAYLSWVLWFQGHADQARQASARSVALARQLEHPFSLAYALTFAAILHCRLRLPEQALLLARETQDISTRHGFPLWQIGALLSQGWALSMQQDTRGADVLQQCVQATREAMGGVTLIVLEPLVHAHVLLGQFDAALKVHVQATEVGSALGDHHIDAELHRLRGICLCSPGRTSVREARACLEAALALGQHQQARTLELRAATDLARLLQGQGLGDAARQVLDAVYPWFTEGLDTPDLQDAQALLASLADQQATRRPPDGGALPR